MSDEFPLGKLPISTPTGWRMSTVGAVAAASGGEVQTGPFGSQLHASDYSEDGTPVVMPQDLIDGRICTSRVARVADEHVRRLDRHCLREGDILFSRRGDVARFAIITRREVGWLCGTGCMRIRLNSPEVHSGYLSQFLKLEVVGKWLLQQAKGITMPNLNTGILSALPLLIPPIAEQKRIAAVLDHADALRTQRRESITKLDTLLQSVFLDIFGDPVTNSKGWTIASMGELIEFMTSGSRGWAKHYATDGAFFIRIQNVGRNEMLTDDVARVHAPVGAEADRTRVRPGDVLLSVTADLGRTAVAPEDMGEAYINQHLVLLRPKGIEPLYLSAFLASDEGQRQIKRLDRKGVKSGLNFENVRSLRIQSPPPDLQVRYARAWARVTQIKKALRKSEESLMALCSSLQTRAFDGGVFPGGHGKLRGDDVHELRPSKPLASAR